MSEFLHRLQERLKKRSARATDSSGKGQLPLSWAERWTSFNHLAQQLLSASKQSLTKNGFNSDLNKSSIILQLNLFAKNYLKPSLVIHSLTYLGMLITIASVTYWLMHLSQIPSPPEALSKNAKGAVLYINQGSTESYALFGSKPMAAENIILRGVVVTDKNKDGLLQGFALFEIDGKPTGAIAVGESLGKGLMLQTITTETATLLYQGKRLNFSLNKSNKDKQANNSGNGSNSGASSAPKARAIPNISPKTELPK